MKKKGVKKFHLNRETLRHLDNQNLGAVVGGITTACPGATADPTACAAASGCASCGDTCGCPIETRRTCPP